jgi:CheY-like chemotaxis protein
VKPPARQGFGLTLIGHTISQHPGGLLAYDWNADGLVVQLKLAAAAPAGQTPMAPASSPQTIRRRRALVVEDEPLIAMELEANLTDLGFLVVGRCATTRDARAIWNQEAAIDLAVLDINLGSETTFELARELAAVGVAVIFCSGYETLDASDAVGAIPILVKPVSKDSLSSVITEIAGRA